MSDLPIRADVSPSMHPGMLVSEAKVLNTEGTKGPQALAAAVEALTTMYRTAGEIGDAERACMTAAKGKLKVMAVRGGMRSFHGMEDELAQASARAVDRALQTVDRRLKELEEYREELGQRVGSALLDPHSKTPEGLAMATEIRGHVKSLTRDRLGFLRKAIDAKDKQTVAAVLGSPPYLSGLKPDQVATLRDIAATKWAVEEYTQLGAVGKTIERVELGKKLLKDRHAEVARYAGEDNNKKAARTLGELASGEK